MSVIDILPTAIYKKSCDFHDEFKRLVLDEVAGYEGEAVNQKSGRLVHLDRTSVLRKDVFRRYREHFEECARDFAVNVLGYYIPDRIVLTDSWLNVNRGNGFQYPHIHENSFVTALYYVNYDADKHAPTLFSRTAHSRMAGTRSISLAIERSTVYNRSASVGAAEGDLVIWDSSLVHGVSVSDNPGRITLAMNFMPNVVTNGDYGWNVSPLDEEQREKYYTKLENSEIWDECEV